MLSFLSELHFFDDVLQWILYIRNRLRTSLILSIIYIYLSITRILSATLTHSKYEKSPFNYFYKKFCANF